METLFQYLYNKGLIENGSAEEIAEAKKEYRKKYLREKKSEYKHSHKYSNITLSIAEFNLLCREAKKRGIKLAPFVKSAALCYVKKEFLLPPDTKVHDLELGMRRIGNNINQIAYYINRNRNISEQDFEQLNAQLSALEAEISRLFRTPVDLISILKQKVEENPEFLEELKIFVQQYETV